MNRKVFWFLTALLAYGGIINAQTDSGGIIKPSFSVANPEEYEIVSVTFQTPDNSALDQGILRMLTGLQVGEHITVPGDKISRAIETLWNQGLFSDIEVVASKIENGKIHLVINLEERPRLSRFTFRGAKKNEVDDLREQLKLIRGKPLNENLIVNARNTVRNFFVDKGYMNAEVEVSTRPDTGKAGGLLMLIEINKNRRIKIREINFYGNASMPARKLRKKMKNTRENPWYSIFTTSKFMEDSYEEDKQKAIAVYHDLGYKDARIVKDSVYRVDDKHISIDIHIDEGRQYFFRNISWVGNTKYSSKQLTDLLGIRKGDVYNLSTLRQNLEMNVSETDITSLYMNDGHLFFSVDPVETVYGDSVDIEMRIYEGKQATINRITISGNEKTSDHVIRREIRTRPGQLFRRSDIIRSQRELIALGYFNQEKMNVIPTPNPQDGTVDIEYIVEEKPSDQLQLSGGWGAGRLIGNLGLAFNNFSAKKFFHGPSWRPLPSGDGQRLSMNASSTGAAFQSYNVSFTEPWLGGRRPNSLTFTLYHSVFGNGLPKNDPSRSVTKNTGIILGFGRRLKWPDDFFSIYHSLSYQYYELKNSSAFELTDGFANNLSLTNTIARNSVDDPIYPRSGSNISLSLQFTAPYSLWNPLSPAEIASDQARYKWVEFYKWKFDVQWFTPLTRNKNALVLMTRANFGFLGMYNPEKGLSPFERFRFGGTGLNGLTYGAQLLGADIVGLRGYPDQSISQFASGTALDAAIYNRFTMELRFPVTLNPSATIFAIGFLEGGTAAMQFKSYDPFSLKRSGGVGVRVFLPMFGLLGLDWAVPFDQLPQNRFPNQQKSYFHFIIGQNFN